MAATDELGGTFGRQRRGRVPVEDMLRIGQFVDDFDREVVWKNSEFEEVQVDPQHPTPARPGSEEKVRMMAARYASGLPLWHHEDCSDHGARGHDPVGLRVADLLAIDATQVSTQQFSGDEPRG